MSVTTIADRLSSVRRVLYWMKSTAHANAANVKSAMESHTHCDPVRANRSYGTDGGLMLTALAMETCDERDHRKREGHDPGGHCGEGGNGQHRSDEKQHLRPEKRDKYVLQGELVV